MAGLGGGRSIRVRTTLVACSVVGLALVLASLALVVFLGRSLTANVRDAAVGRAETIVGALVAGSRLNLDAGDSEDEFVQVLDGGRVVVASANVAGLGPLATPSPGDEVRLDVTPLGGGSFLAVGTEAATADGNLTVVAGRNLDDVAEATSATLPLLLIGVPLLVLVVGWVTWWITGRALAPVESIRMEVESISAEGLDRRVPDPNTGDEIARLAATMNGMLTRLEASQLEQRRFVSDAAHELRSPVASIRQLTEVTLAHPERVSLAELAEVVHRENLRVERMVDDLLLLARLDEGARGSREPVDLDDLVMAEAARTRDAAGIRVDTTAVTAARTVGRRLELGRVVRNLSDNAARHAVSSVAFGLHEADGHVVLTVDDDGPGIDPKDRALVFGRFVRLDDARTRGDGGAGLGLAIVRAVIESHGGHASIGESALGGARFEVTLARASG